MAEKIPPKLRPAYLELRKATKAYLRELDNPVPDTRHRRDMLDWVKHCLYKIEEKE